MHEVIRRTMPAHVIENYESAKTAVETFRAERRRRAELNTLRLNNGDEKGFFEESERLRPANASSAEREARSRLAKAERQFIAAIRFAASVAGLDYSDVSDTLILQRLG